MPSVRWPNPMTRGYQDYAFDVHEIADRVLERLVASVFDDSLDDAPCVVFAKCIGDTEWHRFFLQAHIGFWGMYDDATIDTEFQECVDDGGRLVDYGPLVGGLPRRLRTAAAFVGDFDASVIRLTFDNQRSLMLTPDTADLDTNYHISIASSDRGELCDEPKSRSRPF